MPQRTAVAATIVAALSLAAFSAGPAEAGGGDDNDHGGGHGGGTQVAVPTPTVAGPVTTPVSVSRVQGYPYTASAVDLRSRGYREQEYFVSGTARAYAPVGTLGADGRW